MPGTLDQHVHLSGCVGLVFFWTKSLEQLRRNPGCGVGPQHPSTIDIAGVRRSRVDRDRAGSQAVRLGCGVTADSAVPVHTANRTCQGPGNAASMPRQTNWTACGPAGELIGPRSRIAMPGNVVGFLSVWHNPSQKVCSASRRVAGPALPPGGGRARKSPLQVPGAEHLRGVPSLSVSCVSSDPARALNGPTGEPGANNRLATRVDRLSLPHRGRQRQSVSS